MQLAEFWVFIGVFLFLNFFSLEFHFMFLASLKDDSLIVIFILGGEMNLILNKEIDYFVFPNMGY